MSCCRWSNFTRRWVAAGSNDLFSMAINKRTGKENRMTRSVDSYVTLGRSGLRVSPFCLGTMTFGTEWGWGSEEQVARAVFDKYIDEGGNFIDTADAYTEGHSEELLGKFIHERSLRNRVVLA